MIEPNKLPASFGANGPPSPRTFGDRKRGHTQWSKGPEGTLARNFIAIDLEIEYLWGAENVVADAMSRTAYPATSARQDVSWHGSK